MKSITAIVAVFALFAFGAQMASAQSVSIPYWGANPPILSCTGNYDPQNPPQAGPTRPCTSLCDLIFTARNVVYFAITLTLFAIAPAMFLWGGFLMVVSGGSAERFGKGRKVLVNTAIGVALALGAFVIVATLLWAAGARLGVGGVGWPDIQCRIQ